MYSYIYYTNVISIISCGLWHVRFSTPAEPIPKNYLGNLPKSFQSEARTIDTIHSAGIGSGDNKLIYTGTVLIAANLRTEAMDVYGSKINVLYL